MNILVVRLRLIGDVVFTTPAIRALRRHFPDARITYVVEEEAAPVVAGNPHLDEVIVAKSPRAAGRLRADLELVMRLRRDRYDIAIDMHGGPRSALFAWLSGAPRRIGYEIAGRGWMYTTRVPRPRALRPRHSVESQWDLLLPLGIEPPAPDRDRVEMTENPVAAAAVTRRLESAGVRPEHPLVIVHVSAGNPFRRWNNAAFVDLICRLVAASPDRRVIVTSGPSDAAAASHISAAARNRLGAERERAIVDCGEFDLDELRTLIGRAALYVGGDSGPLHIAATTTTPIVGLYGPTLPVRSQPYRSGAFSAAAEVTGLACRPCNQRVCVHGDFRCLQQISADQVSALAEEAFRQSGAVREA